MRLVQNSPAPATMRVSDFEFRRSIRNVPRTAIIRAAMTRLGASCRPQRHVSQKEVGDEQCHQCKPGEAWHLS